MAPLHPSVVQQPAGAKHVADVGRVVIIPLYRTHDCATQGESYTTKCLLLRRDMCHTVMLTYSEQP